MTYTLGTLTDRNGNSLATTGAVASTDTAPPVLVSAASSLPVSGGNLVAGTVLTLTFSEDIDANSTPAAMDETHFKVEPEGATPTGDLDGATVTLTTVALGAANNQLDVPLATATTGGICDANGGIDLDTFTDVSDNAAVPNSAVENAVLTEVPISGLLAVGVLPEISYTLAVADKNKVYVRFSELVRVQGGGDFSTTTWTYSGAAVVSAVQPLTIIGDYCRDVFLIMSSPVTANDVFALEQITITSTVEDMDLNPALMAGHNVSDIGLNVVVPVWAANADYQPGLPLGKITDFDGSGELEDKDIMVQANIQASSQIGAATRLYFDVNVPAARKTGDLWLPELVSGLVPAANPDAREVDEHSAINALRNYTVPASDSEIFNGAQVEFLLKVGTLYCATVEDANDPRTATPWSFRIRGVITQRGGVTILDNVVNPLQGDKTVLRYTLDKPGMVSIMVFDLSGDIISILERGRQTEGEHTLTWDGKNRSGRAVARGIYFIRVVAPGIDETRKVLVVK